jgi:hypothetical protein
MSKGVDIQKSSPFAFSIVLAAPLHQDAPVPLPSPGTPAPRTP